MATSVVYDSYVGSASEQVMLAAGSEVGYPSSNQFNVFGPLYLPRIYGKDLSAFEIASSGKVSFTLHDKYAFDVDRDAAANTSFIESIPGDSFVIKANNNQISMALDAVNNDLALTASNNLVFNAQQIVYNVTGSSASKSGGDSLMQSEGSAAMIATSNVTIASLSNSVGISSAGSNVYVVLNHTGCNLNEYALHDVNITASNAFLVESGVDAAVSAKTGSMFLNAAASNVSFVFDSSTLSANLVAKSNVSFAAQNGTVSTNAASNIAMTAVAGSISAVAPNASLTMYHGIAMTTPDAFSVTSSALKETASNAAFINVLNGPISLTAAASNTQLFLNDQGASIYALSNVSATASNSIALTATSDVTLASVLGSMYMYDSSNASMALSNNSVALSAASNVAVTASNFIVSAHQGASVTAETGVLSVSASAKDVIVAAMSNVYVTASNGSVSMAAALSNAVLNLDSSTYNVNIYARSNVLATSSNNTSIVANNGLYATAKYGVMALAAASNFTMTTTSSALITAANDCSMTATTGAMTIAAPSSNLNVTAGAYTLVSYGDISQGSAGTFKLGVSSNIGVTSSNASISLSADSSKVQLKLDQPTDGLIGYALSNVSFTAGQNFIASASNNTSLYAKSNLSLSAASGAAALSLGSDQKFHSSAATYTFAATTDAGYTFNVSSSNLVTIQSDKMIVNGGLDVYGTVNSISIQNTELHINDKTLQLSYPLSNESIVDGTNNTSSGMVVYGMPASASGMDQNLASQIYDKSFKWNYGTTGVDGLRTTNGIATESFWELKGGRFQMSATKSDGKNISFALRINEHDELEMVKVWDDANNVTQFRRIAKFGKTIL